MPGAGGSLGTHHQRRDYFEVALLPRLDVEHPRNQRALKPRARTAQHIEPGSRQFHPSIEIDNPKFLAELPMRKRLERGELNRRPLGLNNAIVSLARADDNVGPRDIRKRERQLLDLLFSQPE